MSKENSLLTEMLQPFIEKPDSKKTKPRKAKALLDYMEQIITENKSDKITRDNWHKCLDISGRPMFLNSLQDCKEREKWAEAAFRIIEFSDYSLRTMLEQRSLEHPDRILLHETVNSSDVIWSYDRILRHSREIAAAFHKAKRAPRVVIFLENSASGACSDIACLTNDIFVVPLNVHMDIDSLIWIFNTLKINIAVTDTEERLQKLKEVKKATRKTFQIFVTDHKNSALRDKDLFLGEACARFTPEETEKILKKRPRKNSHEVITTMFTSGSTGFPKGVSFSQYSLVTKRFARAAALPDVGRNEVLLCYLPLFHTFGRFLEMLGMIYWGGTYVFAGNPSAETLIRRLGEIRPTGMIGIPLRWVQIRDKCFEISGNIDTKDKQLNQFRKVVGDKLRWGLSAAGYLDPKVFRFFQRYGVALCSGFGMTEATGGITMTPPSDYSDNSVGVPLPGVKTRLKETGELQISGPYITKYLEDFGPDGKNLVFNPCKEEHWLSTGDIFKIKKNGHYQIVDRLKDIYKNNKGQTIAPKRVEQKFEDVPGIQRTFLVGDGRNYNVLLIVPDLNEPVIQSFSEEKRVSYFNKIVTTANQELAPYERVINTALLKRDFELDLGELTPKKSYCRKAIEKNFAETIDTLYKSNFNLLNYGDLQIIIPRWFYRDLGILESDFEIGKDGLYNRSTKRFLRIKRRPDSNEVLIGDIEYTIEDSHIDLGLFARQPFLWIGNPALIGFCPCKEGWDLSLEGVSEQIHLPFRDTEELEVTQDIKLGHIRNSELIKLNELLTKTIFGSLETAECSVEELGLLLSEVDDRRARIIRSRLQILARHPVEKLRCAAYRILLLDEPILDYSKVFPAFVQSGLSFLNEETIDILTNRNIEKRRLDALRKRLHSYRTYLDWPASPTVRKQFEYIFQLLSNYTKNNPNLYGPARAELSAWILHKEDLELSRTSEKILLDLVDWFESDLAAKTPEHSESNWLERIEFDEQISEFEIEKIKAVIVGTTFLKQSVLLAFDDDSFDLMQIPLEGIWISRILSQRNCHRYRIGINKKNGKHYDILLTLREDFEKADLMEINYLLIAIAGYPYGVSPVPRFGCFRPELGSLSVVYVSDLTVWECIREYNSTRSEEFSIPRTNYLKKLLTRAMGTYFACLRNSGYTILPGNISPTNTVVPELDFRLGSTILSLAGWRVFSSTLSLIKPLIKNFFKRTSAHYPWTREHLKYSWIFDACYEELGAKAAEDFLNKLKNELTEEPILVEGMSLSDILHEYLENIKKAYHAPLPLQNAIDRYSNWTEVNVQATPEAKEEIIRELYRLYRLDRFSSIARYYLYRFTYFSDCEHEIYIAFDELLSVMHKNPKIPATTRTELSQLQATLESKEDRNVFSKLVFPRADRLVGLEVKAVGDSEKKHVIIQSQICDKEGHCYYVYDAIEPSEIGNLYRMFLRQNFPKTISEKDKFFILLDSEERVIGGTCYKIQDNNVVHLDGITVVDSLQNKGLGSALLEDFCMRMENLGMKVVKTHYFLRDFYLKKNFKVDKRWGGLVRFLAPVEPLVPDVDEIKPSK